MSSSYINQIDAAIGAIQPISGANIVITPSGTGGLVVALTSSVSVPGTVTSAGGVHLVNPGVATSPSNEYPAPSLVFTGSYWNNALSAGRPDSFSLDVSMLGSSMDNQSSSMLTLDHTGANIAYFTLGPQIFRFTSGGENVLGTVSGTNFVVSPEHSDGTTFTLTAAANAVGSLTTYTGSNIAVVPPVSGQYVTIAGFVNAANNGRFLVSSSTVGGGGSVTVYNSGGIAEVHAGTSTTDVAYPPQGAFSSVGFGQGVFHLLGTSHGTQAVFTGEPNTIQFAIGMDGDATDAGYMRVINNPATGNHGIEIGAVIDGTGAAPVIMHLGEFQGVPCVNIPSMPLVMGSNGTAATSSLEQPSPAVEFMGDYWTGSSSAIDTWTLQNFLYLGAAYPLTAAANFGGGRAIYTVAASMANPLPPIGATVTVTGFTNVSNNGAFTVIDNRTGSFVVNNAAAVSEAHAGTATVATIPTPTSSLVVNHSGAANAQILLPENSGSVPQYSFINDPSCGLKYIGASQLEIVTAGETFGFSSQGGLFVGTAALSFLSQAGTISGTFDPAMTSVLSAAANAVGPDTAYTGTFSPVIPAGALVSIVGFVNPGNNVTFASVVSCNATTLVVVNSNGVAETHAGLAETSNPCVYMGGGGSTPNNFTATLGLPKVAYDPPTAGVFTASQEGRIWFNTATPSIRYWDGTATQTVTQTIASGQTALGTTLIGSGAASTILSIAATGVLSTDNVAADFASDPSGVTGYAPSASGMLTVIKFCTPGFVNFYQYNNTGAGITPGAININWRVTR